MSLFSYTSQQLLDELGARERLRLGSNAAVSLLVYKEDEDQAIRDRDRFEAHLPDEFRVRPRP